jgi:hypothetical protein
LERTTARRPARRARARTARVTVGRVFDPVIGRFVSADPIEDCGLKTQGWNRYAYVGNRPLSLIDPTDHLCITYMPGENGWRVTACDGLAFFDETWIPIPPFGITNSEAGGGSTSQCRDAQSRCQQFGGAECEAAQIICNDTWAPPIDPPQNTGSAEVLYGGINYGSGSGTAIYFTPDDAAGTEPFASTPKAPRPPWLPSCVTWPGYPKPGRGCTDACVRFETDMVSDCLKNCPSVIQAGICGLIAQNYGPECTAICGGDN